ncbi:HigA family addiction module antitoxin [Saccharomonospora sp. CUA-673]|uniref:HigA family addiction module antitoxin n=1 Tax=Saccharomonospora sp. CUA-673 TaxID=1904969 RepID=UPI002100CC1D|nr:HigA family addiction module antitoxin [Saccharomonospora sp. CUA-673]
MTTTDKAHDPIHPGEILREDFLVPMGISAYALAKAIRVPESRIGEILKERRAITADTGLRLSRYFGLGEHYWTRLQESYDVDVARDALGEQLDDIEPIAAA